MTEETTYTVEDVRAVLDKYPKVHRYGNGRNRTNSLAEHRAWREDLYNADALSLAKINAAAEFCRTELVPTNRITTASRSTYAWKHTMEDRGGGYTTNGEFIVGALLAGLTGDFRHYNPVLRASLLESEAARERRLARNISREHEQASWPDRPCEWVVLADGHVADRRLDTSVTNRKDNSNV